MIDRTFELKIGRARSRTLAKWMHLINIRKWPHELRRWKTDDSKEACKIMDAMASVIGWRWMCGKLNESPPERK